MIDRKKVQVFGETDVGWCAATPPNETSDDDGRPLVRTEGFSAGDPTAPKHRVYDDPEVSALRERLRRCNGMPGLEILAPHEIERARRIFFRDGFVVVRDLLDAEALAAFREASARALSQILAIPGPGGRKYVTETNRLPHRYSYGTSSASRHLLHDAVWASMIDRPTTTPLLESLFGGEYWVVGAGGDLCLPGAIEYQTLHSDAREEYQLPQRRLEQAARLGVELRAADLDHKTRQLIFVRTPPRITINFLMSDLTWENGPIRQIPGTQVRPDSPPTQGAEPMWMRLSTLVGAPAGAGVIRDTRAWHGATPEPQPRDPRHAQRRVRRAVARRCDVQALDAARDLGGPKPSRAGDLQPDQDPARRVAGRGGRHAPPGQRARQGEGRERDLTL